MHRQVQCTQAQQLNQAAVCARHRIFFAAACKAKRLTVAKQAPLTAHTAHARSTQTENTLTHRCSRARLSAHEAHAEDVQLLALHVLRPHVDNALQAEARADCRRRDAMLACPSLCNDALLAHAPAEQRLPEAVVDFVRAGVVEVFALEVDLGAAAVRALVGFAQALRVVQRRLSAHVVFEYCCELLLQVRMGTE